MANLRHSIFSGGRYSHGGYVKGLLNPANGVVQIHVNSMGWDKVYARLRSIPPSVQISISAAMRKNAKSVAETARENAPEDTGLLRESIQEVPTANPLMWTVEANTPYAYFVEDDIHTSYVINGPPPPSVFGDSEDQGPPQGPHYMGRAIADTETASSDALWTAVSVGVAKALTMASNASKGKDGLPGVNLDFKTGRGRGAFSFLKSASSVGLGVPSVNEGGEITPLDLAIRGFE
jgi:hypothetical protein